MKMGKHMKKLQKYDCIKWLHYQIIACTLYTVYFQAYRYLAKPMLSSGKWL